MPMTKNGLWPDALVERLKKLWKKSGKRRDIFSTLVVKDKLLKSRGDAACKVKLNRMGLLKDAVPSAHAVLEKLSAKERALFKKMAGSKKVLTSDVIKRFPKLTPVYIANYRTKLGVTRGNQRSTGKPVEPEPEDGYSLDEQKTIKALDKLLRSDGRFRVRDAAKKLRRDKNKLRGFVTKLVEDGILFGLADPSAGCTFYYSNREAFYDPKRLEKLVPNDEVDRIASLLDEHPRSIERITARAYGDSKHKPVNFVMTLLERFLGHRLIGVTPAGRYFKTERGKEFGLDSRTLDYMDDEQLEKAAAVRTEKSSDVPRNLKQVGKEIDKDRIAKHIEVVPAAKPIQKGDRVSMRFWAEVLYGNQSTDQELIDFVLARNEKPDLNIASGLVQGTFTGITKVDKRRVLVNSGPLKKIEGQFAAAGHLLGDLERQSKHGVYYIHGDDDLFTARTYADMAQLAEGKISQWGMPGSLSAYLKRRMDKEDLYIKWKIQWDLIEPYQYRIGRSLMNADEVYKIIGVHKREYRLIMEILARKRRNLPWPKNYAKVVNVPALMDNIGKRFVTPNTLHLGLWDKRCIFVHNSNFSDVTQYVDPAYALELVMRQWGARGRNQMPRLVCDFNQEKLFGHYLQGTWLMTLPGLQNTLQGSQFEREEFHRFVLSSKEHRQNTFRKDPTNSAVMDWQMLKDGRVRMRVTNRKVMEILQEQRRKAHVRHGVCIITDTQHGSITMQPEAELLFMDYSLYDQKDGVVAGKDDRLFFNGDILHGNNYPQHYSESRPLRLLSINSQINFTSAVHMPLIEHAPNLEEVGWWLGNHEWNTFGRNFSGTNDLEPLAKEAAAYIRGIQELEKRFGERVTKLRKAMSVARIRWMQSHNGPEGDIVNWPFFTDTLAGFKVGITHMWQPWGGRTPMHQFQRWIRGMAVACGDIDVMVGGHLHSVWFMQEANKLALQLGAAAGLSGYELARGLFSTVMFTRIVFDNREGVWVEYVPPEFLFFDYEPKSPFLKDRKKELMRPKPGTREHDLGFQSPFIEDVISDLTHYRLT